MALFTSLNTALSGIRASIFALHTTAHNISNASTPGYTRQRVDLVTNPPNDFVRFSVGTGVQVTQIRRLIDTTLEGRLRDAASTLGNLATQSANMDRLESLVNALSGSDIGAQIGRFFDALEDLAQNPKDMSMRTQVIEAARTLTQSFNFVTQKIREARDQLNDEVVATVGEINRITDEIAALNDQIKALENGGIDLGKANDLRDRRDLLIRQLSEIVKINAVETSTGEVNVLVGSSFLVFGSQSFDITTVNTLNGGLLVANPVFVSGLGSFDMTDGKLFGIIQARDNLLGGTAQDLNVLAHAFANEINKIHSRGGGLQRLTDVTSTSRITDPTFPIAIGGQATATSTPNTLIDASLVGFPDLTGRSVLILSGSNTLERRQIVSFDPSTGTMTLDTDLPRAIQPGDRFQIGDLDFPVQNGSFKVVVTSEAGGQQQTFTVDVDLNKSVSGGVITDTALNDIVAQIDSFLPGQLDAEVTADNRLRLRTLVANVTFRFEGDTSGFLAAMGVNTLFTGNSAETIGVNPLIADNPALLAAAQSNNAGDNKNLLALLDVRSRATVLGQANFEEFYQGIVGEVSVATATLKDRFENQKLIQEQLQNQRDRVSGVNLDEEAINMIQFERMFQASAKMISVVDEVLRLLMGAT